jgi:rubredoxin
MQDARCTIRLEVNMHHGSGIMHLILLLNKEAMMWRCTVCGYVYDEAKEGTKFEDLPDDWKCPVCNAPKEAFVKM